MEADKASILSVASMAIVARARPAGARCGHRRPLVETQKSATRDTPRDHRLLDRRRLSLGARTASRSLVPMRKSPMFAAMTCSPNVSG